MEDTTISRITERLRQLPADKLAVVLDFVSHLGERQGASESLQTMLASEEVLRRDWDRAEEEATCLPSGELPFDPTARPIWELFADIMSTVPQRDLLSLPEDGAEEHDHYIYGTPKHRE